MLNLSPLLKGAEHLLVPFFTWTCSFSSVSRNALPFLPLLFSAHSLRGANSDPAGVIRKSLPSCPVLCGDGSNDDIRASTLRGVHKDKQ